MANNSNQSENRLAKEKSPYLLQHKHNPVDWYAWGQEAFEKARKEDKLIFLSVGYSTCHWCHVMNTESFENPATAEIMNNNFVNIKLDREERPDVDKIYMTYIQAISGGGGWPMSVWLTPDLKPIFGGTYFPPKDAYGRPGFPTLLQWIADKWKNAREDLNQQAEKVIRLIKESQEEKESQDISLNELPITKCFDQIAKSYEPFYGGFGEAPKFPRPVVFNLLFQCVAKDPNSVRGSKALEMINHTLIKMGEGGMFDHLDGGFHRYSVTKDWHIPHFEKMLYDQGQLVNSYLDAFLVTHDPFFEKRARDVLDYVLKCLTSKEGGFYSAEDADSIIEHGKKEHAEGAFYVWTSDQIAEIITDPKELKVFNYHFGVKDNGNVAPGADPHGELAGKNHLKITHSIKDTAQDFELTQEEVQDIINRNCKKLNEVREKRPRPHLDDKIITAWNGLMISAYARAYQVLNDNKYLQAAEKATQFIYDNLYNKDSKTLIRNYREGPSNIRAFTDDYAFLISGLLDLYEASFNLKWLKWAIELQETQNKLFWDDANGGYFAVEEGDKNLVLRMKEDYDGAEPCNNSVSAHNLVRLEQFTGNEFFRTCAELIFRQFSKQLSQTPITIPQMCVALSYYIDKPRQIVIAGQLTNDDTKEMLREVNSNFIPNKIVLLADQGPSQAYLAENLPFIKDMKMINGKATAYVCENYACNLPVSSVSELKKILTKSK